MYPKKTTPGPWYSRENKVFRDVPEKLGGPSIDSVAICLGDVTGSADANAQLIAQAPEMKEKLDLIRWHDPEAELPPEECQDWVLVVIDFHEPGAKPKVRLATYDHYRKKWRTQFAECKPYWEVLLWMYLPEWGVASVEGSKE